MLAILFALAIAQPSVTQTAKVIGEPEIVFNYQAQACDAWDIPDTPARAYRDYQENIIIIDSSYTTRRIGGSSFDYLWHPCAVAYASVEDTIQEDYNYRCWSMAPWTADGKNIVDVMHCEWYGRLVNPYCTVFGSWLNSFSITQSEDGGWTFYRPANALLRYPATQWSNSFPCTSEQPTRYGNFDGTNIVHVSYGDGGTWYYRLFHYLHEPAPATRTASAYRLPTT